MTSLSTLRAQVQALKKRIPPPSPPIAVVRSIVSPNPVPGGPPVSDGIAERTTAQMPVPGYPAIIEIWEPLVADMPPPLTKAEAARFFELIGQARHMRPADIAARAVRGFLIWRNSPIGPAVARYGRVALEIVQPLWPKYQT